MTRPATTDVGPLIEREADPVPRDVAESWKAKAENYQQERADALADIADMMANHVENWPAPKKLSTAIALIGKTLDAMGPNTTLTTLQARVDALEVENARLRSQVFLLREQWVIGAKVTMADHVDDSEMWNREDWFVVGIQAEVGCDGLNISVSEHYPLKSRGTTDGFYVDRPFKSDDLIIDTLHAAARAGAAT